MGFPCQDPSTVDLSALDAANRLALQRMQLYKEDKSTATNVCKRPSNKGKGDGAKASGS